MSIIVSPTPPSPIQADRVQYGEGFEADFMANASAVSAWIMGHLMGQEALPNGQANPAPRNPHGRFGHDHSGGIYGVPLFRSIATYWMQTADRGSGEWAGNPEDEIGFYFRTGSMNPEDKKRFTTQPFLIFPPNCDPGPTGAYNNLGVALLMNVASSSLSDGDDTVTIRLRNISPDLEELAVETTLDDVSATGFDRFESGSDGRLPMHPGVPNLFVIEIDVELNASSGVRGIELQIAALELGVYQSY